MAQAPLLAKAITKAGYVDLDVDGDDDVDGDGLTLTLGDGGRPSTRDV